MPGHVNTQHEVNFWCPITNQTYKRKLNSFHKLGFRESDLTEAVDCHISVNGVVEFMTGNKNNFLGLMWHPERCKKFNEIDITLFRTFFGKKI